MGKSTLNTYGGSITDEDSGISLDYDYSSSSSDLDRSVRTFIQPRSSVQSKSIPFPIANATYRKRIHTIPLIKFTSDGIVERIRPVTMKNSQNGDYIICQTNRGTYIAYRTPIIPAWVTQLVREVEAREN